MSRGWFVDKPAQNRKYTDTGHTSPVQMFALRTERLRLITRGHGHASHDNVTSLDSTTQETQVIHDFARCCHNTNVS